MQNKTDMGLSFDEVLCPVCLSVLIEPVTMPCRHTLCMPCFQDTVAQSALACPVCRMRISTWTRHSRKHGTLVNEKLWNYIQEKYKEKVEARLEGRDDSDDEAQSVVSCSHHISQPGEIKQEFEAQMTEYQDELQKLHNEEETASRRLIDEIKNKDEVLKLKQKELQNLCQNDREVAHRVRLDGLLNKSQTVHSSSTSRCLFPKGASGKNGLPSPQSGPMDVYLGQFTPRYCGKVRTNPTSNNLSSPVHHHSQDKNRKTQLTISPRPQESERLLQDITHSQTSSSDESQEFVPLTSKNNKELSCVTSGKENSAINTTVQVKKRCLKSSQASKHKRNGTVIKEDHLGKVSHGQVGEYSPELYENDIMLASVSVNFPRNLGDESDTTDTEEAVETPAKRPRMISDFSESQKIKNCSISTSHSTNVDIFSIFSKDEIEMVGVEKLLQEQRALENRLIQEREDRRLALQLQKQLHQVDRTKGSQNEYGLRSRDHRPNSSHHRIRQNPVAKCSRQRQTTLTETLAKSRQHHSY